MPGPTLHRGRGGLAALHVDHRALPYMLQIGGQNKFHPPTAQDTTWYSWHAEIQTTCNSSGEIHSCAEYTSCCRNMAPQVAPRLRTAERKLSAPTYPNGGLACMELFKIPLVLQATWRRTPAPWNWGPWTMWTVRGPPRGPFRGPL